MSYRKLPTFDLPLDTLNLLIELHMRSMSSFPDNEQIRMIEYGKFDMERQIIPLTITLEKEERVKVIKIDGKTK